MRYIQVGQYLKVKRNLKDRDAILCGLRGHYGTSTKKAFKVLGFENYTGKMWVVVEGAWGIPVKCPLDYFDV